MKKAMNIHTTFIRNTFIQDVDVMESTIYIRLRHRIQVHQNHEVKIKDVARVIAEDQYLSEIENLFIHQVKEEDKNMIVLDGMRVIKAITEKFDNVDIQIIGPQQTIVEVIYKKSKLSLPLFLIVWILLFVGSALTIMNFHEDVSMQVVHQKLFKIITGSWDEKPLLFQIPYSIGLGLGMILFFNHLFKKRINEEPSPLEVEMFNYQQSIDQYVIMHENKESIKNIDDH